MTTKISRTSRARRTTYISREVKTISRATQTAHTGNDRGSLVSTAYQTTSALNSPINIATKTGTATKIFSTRTRMTTATEQEREQDIRSDRQEDMMNQSSVTTQTTYMSNVLTRPTVLIMASTQRQQEDNNK